MEYPGWAAQVCGTSEQMIFRHYRRWMPALSRTDGRGRRSDEASLRPRNLEIAEFVIVHAVEALAPAAVLHCSDVLRSDAFLDEVTELIVRYLARDGAA